MKCFRFVYENLTTFPFDRRIVGKLDSWAFWRCIRFQDQRQGLWEISKKVTTLLPKLRCTQQNVAACAALTAAAATDGQLAHSRWTPRPNASAGYSPPRRGPFPNYFGQTCCKMVDWFWWNSSLISTTNWFPSVLWHCWFRHLVCKNRPRNDLLCVEWYVKPYTLTHSLPSFANWDQQTELNQTLPNGG